MRHAEMIKTYKAHLKFMEEMHIRNPETFPKSRAIEQAYGYTLATSAFNEKYFDEITEIWQEWHAHMLWQVFETQEAAPEYEEVTEEAQEEPKKKFYKVSFQYSENVYCSNIAEAETAADVEKHYSNYSWCSVTEANENEVEAAKRKGMPIIKVEHIEEEPETEETTEETPEVVFSNCTQYANIYSVIVNGHVIGTAEVKISGREAGKIFFLSWDRNYTRRDIRTLYRKYKDR